jgi:general secretion pathway protein M
MKRWWEQLSERDRRALSLLGLIGLIAGFWLGAVSPLIESRNGLRKQLATAERELYWMRGAAADLAQRRANGQLGMPGDRAGQSLLGLADKTAHAAGLGDGLKRIEPVGGNRVNVWLENVAFDKAAVWLETLSSQYGIGVESFAFDRTVATGAVNGRITLQDRQQ